MPRIRPSKAALLCLGLMAIVVLVVFGLIYFNRAEKFQTLEAKVKSEQEALANSQRTAMRLDAVEQEYQDDQMKLSVLEKGVSTKAYVPTLLRQLEELGTQSKLKVLGVKPKAPEVVPLPPPPPAGAEGDKTKQKQEVKKPDPYDKLEVEIEVTGKYWDVENFLGKITVFPKIVAVRDIQIIPATDPTDTGSPKLSVKLNVTAFILKDTPVQAPPVVQMTDAAPTSRQS